VVGVNDEIRPAASVLVARPSDDGPEVLVLERSPEHRFLPGYVVFPGGAVDRDDGALAARWFGSDRETARAAAIRELAEETGLAITAAGVLGTLDEDPDGDPIELVHHDPPAADQLAELCHWVAPEEVPVRFDARYFAVAASGRPAPRVDGIEATRAWWIRPPALLDAWMREERRLYWPTWYTVNRIAECEDVESLLACRFDTREPDGSELERLPRSVFRQD
jgi:8-oxo-dGTP pyrophosphatase MutT (NUDIX family)